MSVHLDLLHGPGVAQAHHHAHQLIGADHSEKRTLSDVFYFVCNLPIVLGVEHFERLLDVIIKLVISTLLLHQNDKLLEKWELFLI